MFTTRDLRPMLAVGGDPEPPLEGEGLVYEPKYDGIRALVEVVGGDAPRVGLWSRNGNEKSAQFPDIVAALVAWGRAIDAVVVLDGEIVALDAAGRPQGFQRLQHRINVSVPGYRSKKAILPPDEQPAALVVFDLLRFGDLDLRDRPLSERRQALEHLVEVHPFPSGTLRMTEQHKDSGRALYARTEAQGWEGLLVKHARSPYRAGKRSPEWRKLKLQKADEFVVCGYTDPQGTRARFGALVLGIHDRPTGARGSSRATSTTAEPATLRYVGDVGTGFSQAEIERLWNLLTPLATETSPLHDAPASLERRAHWVRPVLVAQVRYTEMTDEGRLRHPAYLGLRDDKGATEVQEPAAPRLPAGSERATAELDAVVDQLTALEKARKDGRIALPDGDTLDVTNLHKVFWPEGKRTKGDLLRYYARVSPLILPVVDDRPLVMKRLPDGVTGQSFYQHRAPDPVPPGVRIETLPDDDVPARLVGGSLKTLLYMAQLASISMDPWFSRMDALDTPDQVAIDLDPQPGATFGHILDVARWVRDDPRPGRCARLPQDLRLRGASHLHPAAARHALPGRDALLPDRRDDGGEPAPEGGHGGADGGAPQRRHHLRGLSAEHPGQDARLRLQRARECLCRRLGAAHVGGGRRRRRPPGLHHRHPGRARGPRRRPLGHAPSGPWRRPARRDREAAVGKPARGPSGRGITRRRMISSRR